MIQQLWETNVFHLNLQSAETLLGLDEAEQFNKAVPLVERIVEQFLAKGYAKRPSIQIVSPNVSGVCPTFCAVWFVRGGHRIVLGDPRSHIPGSDQFEAKPWSMEVVDGDIFIFPAYVEYDYEVLPDNEVIFFDIITENGWERF